MLFWWSMQLLFAVDAVSFGGRCSFFWRLTQLLLAIYLEVRSFFSSYQAFKFGRIKHINGPNTSVKTIHIITHSIYIKSYPNDIKI